MKAYVFNDLPSAQAAQAHVDQKLGMPIAGVNIGGGIHAPPSQSVTTTYAVPVKHPTLPQWSIASDPVVDAKVSDMALPAPATLDTTWTPAPVILAAMEAKQ